MQFIEDIEHVIFALHTHLRLTFQHPKYQQDSSAMCARGQNICSEKRRRKFCVVIVNRQVTLRLKFLLCNVSKCANYARWWMYLIFRQPPMWVISWMLKENTKLPEGYIHTVEARYKNILLISTLSKCIKIDFLKTNIFLN